MHNSICEMEGGGGEEFKSFTLLYKSIKNAQTVFSSSLLEIELGLKRRAKIFFG